jgi:hypothetical protein
MFLQRGQKVRPGLTDVICPRFESRTGLTYGYRLEKWPYFMQPCSEGMIKAAWTGVGNADQNMFEIQQNTSKNWRF